MYYIFINVVCKQLYINRDTISIPYTAESSKKDLINKKFDSISRHMEIHKYVHRTEMASIINLIDSVCKYKQSCIIAILIYIYIYIHRKHFSLKRWYAYCRCYRY